MGHDATKVVMGATPSSDKTIDNVVGSDPATFQAGLVVCLASTGLLDLATANGTRIGVSMGRSLSGDKVTAVCRRGLRVPVQLTAAFTPVIGAAVAISNTTGKAKAYTGTGDGYINATYASGALTAINEDGTESASLVALIDMPGGV